MNIYQIAEKKLAELLGYAIDPDILERCGTLAYYKGKTYHAVPEWTQDDAAAFKLVVEYEIEVTFPQIACVQALYFLGNSGYHCSEERAGIHNNDKHLATRYAIVLAVIAKLEGETK